MSGKKFCRLCLNEVFIAYTDMYSTDFHTRKILSEIFPGMNMALTNAIRLCEDCYHNINFINSVKNSFRAKEKQYLLERFNSRTDQQLCTLCYREKTPYPVFLRTENCSNDVLKEMIEIALADSRYCSSDINILLCGGCSSWINKIYSFKRQCFKMEEILKFFCSRRKLSLLKDSDLDQFLEEQYYVRTGKTFSGIQGEQLLTPSVGILIHREYMESTSSNIYGIRSKQFKNNIISEENTLTFVENFEKEKVLDTCAPADYQSKKIEYETEVFEIESEESHEKFTKRYSVPLEVDTSAEEVDSSTPTQLIITIHDDDSDIEDICCTGEVIKQEPTLSEPLHNSENTNRGMPDTGQNHEESLDQNNNEPNKRLVDGNISENHEVTRVISDVNFRSFTYNLDELVETRYASEYPHDDQNEISSKDRNGEANMNEITNDCGSDMTEIVDIVHSPAVKMSKTRDLWACYDCDAKYYDKTSMRYHALRHEDPCNKFGTFQCRHCPYRANRKASVTRHQQIHSPEVQKSFGGCPVRFFCPYCSAHYRTKEDIQSHLKEHFYSWQEYACIECMFTTNLSRSLRTHYLNHHHNCPIRWYPKS